MDLDEEKLKATRKLHGLDKENGSDINVGSIEEDIKKVKELNNLLKFFKTHGWIPDMSRKLNTNATIESIEHLLSDYTRQKQINEEHQKENGLLKEKIYKKINYYDERIRHSKLIKDKEQEDFYFEIRKAFYKLLEDK